MINLAIAKDITALRQVQEKLGLALTKDSQFFTEWLTETSGFSQAEQARLDQVRRNYLYQLSDGILLEETINNAIDALDGSGQIWIRTFQEPNCVLVEIADNGRGIPWDIQPRIFEPFFTTKGTGEGTGLGLDVSRYRGDIRVTSKPDDTCV